MLGKRGQHPAVAVGAHGQAIGPFQQELARCRIDRRHRALAEDVQVFFGQPEAVLRGEESQRLLVRRRTGHQVERDPHPVPLGRGQDLFDMDLKQASAGNGADRKHALGMVKPQAGSLPSRDQDDADLPRRQGLLTPARASAGEKRFFDASSRKDDHGYCRRRSPQGQIAEIALVLPLRIQLLDQREIDAADLPGQRLALPGVQICPKGQQMFLPVLAQDCRQVAVAHDYQPMTMFDSIALRACSRSVPVLCM